ncbi:hypothetical protein PoB_001949600 [Plakobranchus ocellatus]|uniref:Uncharacterized protein n=1 Tax=Plakobranchus ocellatus TaxID=259542 RepID=A0AAV3Z0Z3_9GAST|nr:hypothetical protein PoB_001949600 [Plakobranchus ocellatus]
MDGSGWMDSGSDSGNDSYRNGTGDGAGNSCGSGDSGGGNNGNVNCHMKRLLSLLEMVNSVKTPSTDIRLQPTAILTSAGPKDQFVVE